MFCLVPKFINAEYLMPSRPEQNPCLYFLGAKTVRSTDIGCDMIRYDGLHHYF